MKRGSKLCLDGQGSDEMLLVTFAFLFHLKRNMLNPVKFISEYLGGSKYIKPWIQQIHTKPRLLQYRLRTLQACIKEQPRFREK